VKAFYEHLAALAKNPMWALVTVMRILLHAIYGMFRHDPDFEGDKFHALTGLAEKRVSNARVERRAAPPTRQPRRSATQMPDGWTLRDELDIADLPDDLDVNGARTPTLLDTVTSVR
jgi:hypothetical protein